MGQYRKLPHENYTFNKETREFVSQISDNLNRLYTKAEAFKEIHETASGAKVTIGSDGLVEQIESAAIEITNR